MGGSAEADSSAIAATAPGNDLVQSRDDIDRNLRELLMENLSVDPDIAAAMRRDSGLFGSLPELDSMAVAQLLTSIEDRFNFVIGDDEVDGEMLETYGALMSFIEAKLLTA